MKKLVKEKVEEEIKNFFKNLKHSPKEIKKIKKLAMHYNIKLGFLRKKFCKKCYSSLERAEVRIKKGKKIVKCKNCGYVARWKVK